MTIDINNLTLDQAKEEIKKLKDVENGNGFLYFLKYYVKVSHPTRGSVAIGKEMYKWQERAAKELLSSQKRFFISKKTRQVGFSTFTGAFALWRALFFESQKISIVSIGQRESTNFLTRIKFMYDRLPVWLRQEKIEDAKTYITFRHNNSTINSLPNGADPARGESLSLLIADEFAAYGNQNKFMAAAIPALSAGTLTKSTNETLPSMFLLISTYPVFPINNQYVRILNETRDQGNDSKYHIIDVVTDDISFYKSKNWHEEMKTSLGDRAYRVEILGEEVYDYDESLLPSSIFDRETLQPVPPIRVDFLHPEDVDEEGYYVDMKGFDKLQENYDSAHHYMKGFAVWEDPFKDKEYVIVADVATGRGGDFSAFLVFDLEMTTQVAEFKGKVHIEAFKEILETVAGYYNNAKLSVESNSMGEGLCQYFGYTVSYENFYWHKKFKKQFVPGFPTTTSTRANSIFSMQSKLLKGEIVIRSSRVISELKAFGYTKTGKLAALSGNDDFVACLWQYAYLIDVSFAATEKQIENNMIFFNEIEDEKEKLEEEAKKIPKYFYDILDDALLTPEQRELLMTINASGGAISQKDAESILQDIARQQ